MTTFAERKQARIASPKTYQFGVWASGLNAPLAPLAAFKSRKEAEEFAFGQIGHSVGNARAWQMLHRLHAQAHPNGRGISAGQSFEVRRIDAETGEQA